MNEKQKPCKNGDTYCGHYYTCGKCKAEEYKDAGRRMTQAEHAYDDHVDPRNAYHPL